MKVKEPEILKGVMAGAIFVTVLLSLIFPCNSILHTIFNYVIGLPLAILLSYHIAKFLTRHKIFYR